MPPTSSMAATIPFVIKAKTTYKMCVFLSNLACIICRKVLEPGALILISMQTIEKRIICIHAPEPYQYEPLKPYFKHYQQQQKLIYFTTQSQVLIKHRLPWFRPSWIVTDQPPKSTDSQQYSPTSIQTQNRPR